MSENVREIAIDDIIFRVRAPNPPKHVQGHIVELLNKNPDGPHVIVRPKGKKFDLIDGYYLVKAAQESGKERIKVIVTNESDAAVRKRTEVALKPISIPLGHRVKITKEIALGLAYAGHDPAVAQIDCPQCGATCLVRMSGKCVLAEGFQGMIIAHDGDSFTLTLDKKSYDHLDLAEGESPTLLKMDDYDLDNDDDVEKLVNLLREREFVSHALADISKLGALAE